MDWIKCSIITFLDGFESRPTTARLSTSHTRAIYFPKAYRRLYAQVLNDLPYTLDFDGSHVGDGSLWLR